MMSRARPRAAAELDRRSLDPQRPGGAPGGVRDFHAERGQFGADLVGPREVLGLSRARAKSELGVDRLGGKIPRREAALGRALAVAVDRRVQKTEHIETRAQVLPGDLGERAALAQKLGVLLVLLE